MDRDTTHDAVTMTPQQMAALTDTETAMMSAVEVDTALLLLLLSLPDDTPPARSHSDVSFSSSGAEQHVRSVRHVHTHGPRSFVAVGDAEGDQLADGDADGSGIGLLVRDSVDVSPSDRDIVGLCDGAGLSLGAAVTERLLDVLGTAVTDAERDGLAVPLAVSLIVAVTDTLAVTLTDDVSDGDAVSDPRLGVTDGDADGTTTYSSRRSNSTSVDVSVAWCTSTAMTLSPTTSTPLGMTMLSTTRDCAAVVPVNPVSATVAAVMAAGAAAMLRRPTSTPLTCTTAPSATRASEINTRQ
jgi:hypothetical protein